MSEVFAFPEAFVIPDEVSLDGQKRFIRSTRVQLLLLVTASAAGAFAWQLDNGWDAAALVAGLAFAAAAALRTILLLRRPHRDWYDGRAAAESIKTLAWKYAVGGDPFVLDQPDAETRFTEVVRDVLSSFHKLSEKTAQISASPTEGMTKLRRSPLGARQKAFLQGRIVDQEQWYAKKARWNRERARFWGGSMLALQIAAAVGAFLKGFNIIDIDLFGLAGAAAASAAAWLETKQHQTIARAYAVAAQELASIRDLVSQQTTEKAWGTFVAESEEAISREHTMWKASTRTREPVSLA